MELSYQRFPYKLAIIILNQLNKQFAFYLLR
jgi:hypothetical protein